MAQSNFDRRRINGPEESFSPTFEVDETEVPTAGTSRAGRGPLDIRPICSCWKACWKIQRALTLCVLTDLKPGLISQANGSAYIETEKTKIACAVCVVLNCLLRLYADVVFLLGMDHGSLGPQHIARRAG